ncbi:MAG TPA: MBL fold metallo-hydrolase [Gammaproteobacteria bacterium]|nr:MBL fold metallo-hydrolase [Gammaproteobacteria bacterium]
MNARVRFLGAAGEVTGSCHLVEWAGHRILLDCGLFQGSPAQELRNHQAFPFDPASIDAVILSHAHLDHSGRLPSLVRQGFRGPIYAHAATRDLARIMLLDAAELARRDAESAAKHGRSRTPATEPLYGPVDVERCLDRFHALMYGKRAEVLPGLNCRLQDAGHILGAAITELWFEGDGEPRKLVFSGDLGSQQGFIMPPPVRIEDSDCVILESAYGDRRHRSAESTLAELGQIIAAARAAGGNILIPAFSVGRTQELLFVLGRHHEEWGLKDWVVFLDSPMAIEATAVYVHHAALLAPKAADLGRAAAFSFPGLHCTPTTGESIAINRVSGGAIIIAGSGMCSGGRILHHLKQRLSHRNTHLVFVGFQAAGTLGRRLVEGAREVTLWGESVPVAAQVHTVGGLSAHADQEALCHWYAGFKDRPRVAVVHGEPQASTALAAELRRRFGCPVTIPARGDSLDLGDLTSFARAERRA